MPFSKDVSVMSWRRCTELSTILPSALRRERWLWKHWLMWETCTIQRWLCLLDTDYSSFWYRKSKGHHSSWVAKLTSRRGRRPLRRPYFTGASNTVVVGRPRLGHLLLQRNLCAQETRLSPTVRQRPCLTPPLQIQHPRAEREYGIRRRSSRRWNLFCEVLSLVQRSRGKPREDI